MKNVIKKNRVELLEQARGKHVHFPSAGAAAGPSARLIRVDGRVEAIEFTCACGDTSVLEIDYEVNEAKEVA